jgi:uncharacterized membrane protein
MKGLVSTFKSIALGGVLFLIPLTIAVLVFAQVLEFLTAVAEPMAEFLPTDTILGFGLAQILAVVLLLLVCFVAGLIARAAVGQRLIEKVERGLRAMVPGYAVIKGFADQVLKSHDQAESFRPILVPTDGGQRPAFEVERLPTGDVVVLFPGAPNAWSGWVAYVKAEEVEPLDMKATDLLHSLEQLGIGSSQFLRNTGGA